MLFFPEPTGVSENGKPFVSDCSDEVQAHTLDIVSLSRIKSETIHGFSDSYCKNASDCPDQFSIGLNSFRTS